MLQPSVVTESGERIIPGSRRPDGTLRKERRVRAGYVPQDEQPVYQSVGALWKQGVPKCPGLDDAELEATKEAAKSKAQKKNEKRKAKRVAEAVQPVALNQAAQQLQNLSVSSSVPQKQPPAQQAAPEPAPSTAADDPSDPKAQLEKQIRNLKKKIRQCDALVDRKKAGQPLNGPETEKLGKLPGWEKEVDVLEEQLKGLA